MAISTQEGHPSTETSSVIQNPETVVCHESEREALLRFKQQLKDATNRLSTWNLEEDCCKWAGIFCDSETGSVNEISLFTPPRHTVFESDGEYERAEDAYGGSKLSGKISEPLLNLTHLTHLDLSSNDFGGIPIPKFIGSLRNLRYLNLSGAGFGGMIPHELGNLSSLRLLGLRSSSAYQSYVDNPQWLQGLSLLEHLDMSYVDLSSKASADLLQVMMSSNLFPSLSELRISSCKLPPSKLSQKLNFTSLSILDISTNNFASMFPTWILNLSTLTSLDLSHNYIEGPIPCGFQNMTALKHLDLSSNNLDSSIPDCLYEVASLENLSILDISTNNFTSIFPTWILNLSTLTSLDLSYNSIKGPIPCGFQNMTALKHLHLSYNNLDSSIPGCLYEVASLENLDLYSNNLQGKISSTIQNLISLVHIDLSDNHLEGEIPTSVGNLSNLKEIYLGFNKLSGDISMTLDSFSLGCASQGLLSLNLAGNLFFGHMRDDEFRPLQSLIRINLFQNSISGLLPTSIGSLSNLEKISIGENNLEGIISEVHFANLTKLLLLDALGNPLTLKVDSDWIPSFSNSEFIFG